MERKNLMGEFQIFFSKNPSKLKKFSEMVVVLTPNPPGDAPAPPMVTKFSWKLKNLKIIVTKLQKPLPPNA